VGNVLDAVVLFPRAEDLVASILGSAEADEADRPTPKKRKVEAARDDSGDEPLDSEDLDAVR
jgi:hypothetical protein